MTTKDEALRLAREAVEDVRQNVTTDSQKMWQRVDDAISAIDAAAQPVASEPGGERAELVRELDIIAKNEWQGFFPGSVAEHRKKIVEKAATLLSTDAKPASEPVAVPHGMKLVPVEPTREMCRALFRNLVHADDEARVIRAVIDAAPATPQAQPLTIDKKYAMFCSQNTKYSGRYIDMESFYDGIEAAEQAYGITPDVSGDIGHE